VCVNPVSGFRPAEFVSAPIRSDADGRGGGGGGVGSYAIILAFLVNIVLLPCRVPH
jgi:hypothetical protein